MPELPDVEGYRRDLAQHLPGLRIREVRVLDDRILRNANAQQLSERLVGRRFGKPSRRGKWLLLPVGGPTLLIHNAMTGVPYFRGADDSSATRPHERLVIVTNGGELHYADLRKLRGIWIADSDDEIAAVIGEQGIDALGASRADLREAVRGRRGALKAVLMNQQVIAGLGNMLSDEICWRARLHPATAADRLDDGALNTLHREMQATLRASVRQGHIPRTGRWLTSTRQQDPAPCPRCHTTLRRTRIGGRTSIWCPQCQPERR